jgi:hypothetical protein
MTRRRRVFLTFLFFAAGALLYELLWLLIGSYTLRALGYHFWLLASPEDLLNSVRIAIARIFLGAVAPFLFGVVCAGWGNRWLRRRNPQQK